MHSGLQRLPAAAAACSADAVAAAVGRERHAAAAGAPADDPAARQHRLLRAARAERLQAVLGQAAAADLRTARNTRQLRTCSPPQCNVRSGGAQVKMGQSQSNFELKLT